MEGYEDSPISTDLSQTVAEDEAVLKIMETKYKIDKETVLQVLRENVYNDISAVYFLLYYDKENRRASVGGDSDTVKVTSTAKKELTSSSPSGANMPVIDEDAVLPEMTESPREVRTAVTAKPVQLVSGARRKRAATVNAGGGETESPPPQSKSPEISQNRPQTAFPVSEQESQKTPPVEGQAQADTAIRKRTNTIIGVLRGKKAEEPDVAEDASDADKPRSLRFTFNSNTTSSKPPDEIIVEVIKTCNKLGLTHRLLTRYLLECTSNTSKEPLKLEIEVCKLPRLNNLHGLKFKRLAGASSEYKEVCEKLLEMIQI
jgi:MAP/microtubule affinity-regulating kinase